MSTPEAAARRQARQAWPVRRFRLGEEPGDDLGGSTTAEERLAMMWPLALSAWASSGLPIPTYSRAEMPMRLVRLGRARLDRTGDDGPAAD